MTIGQFSKLSAIPITTLRFWEQKGIFAPTLINPQSGYRYYDTDQLEQVNIITALQQCGLTNAEIRRCTAPGTGMEIFASRLNELKQARYRLEEAIRYLNFYLENSVGNSAIVLKSIPGLWYLSSRKRFADTHEMHLEFASIVDYIIKNKLSSSQPFQTVGIYREQGLKTDNFDYECFVRATSAPQNCPYAFTLLPAIETAVTIIYKGTYEIPDNYHNLLLDWIDIDVLPGGPDNFEGAFDLVSAYLSTNGSQFDYWFIGSSTDEFAIGAARAVEQLGMEGVSLISAIMGGSVIDNWNSGYTGSWKSLITVPIVALTEPMICGMLAILDGRATYESLWPDSVPAGQTYGIIEFPPDTFTIANKDTYWASVDAWIAHAYP